MKSKLRLTLIACVMTLIAAAFTYGDVRWPDSPIDACDETRNYAIKSHSEGYCGKQGQPHTLADYQAYHTYTTGMLIGWPFGMALCVILFYAKRQSSS